MDRRPGLRVATAAAVALSAALCLISYTASAAGYIKLGDIKGESTESKDHKGEIEIQSWSWGETRSSGLATGKRQHKPITITKSVDKASPMLKEASTTGKAIPSIEVTLPKDGGGAAEYVKHELKNVRVTSYSAGGEGQSRRAAPTETFTLTYDDTMAMPARLVQRNASDVEFVRERPRRQQ